MPSIVALISNLFFVSKLQAAAQSVKVPFLSVATPKDLESELEKHSPSLLILELGMPSLDYTLLVRNLRQKERTQATPISAFIYHTRLKEFEGLKSLGVEILSKDAFIRAFTERLQTLA
jgi:PleD family two-component response regulator